MNRFTYSYLSAFIIALIIITPLTYSQAPTHYLIEESRHEFYTNGTEKTPFTAWGHLDIELPNANDVLQYIRINISNDYTGNTNIVSPATFRDTAASPNTGDRSQMYFDTTEGYSLRYNITNPSLIPQIILKLAYKNAEGGRDIHSGSPNTILFNITITSDKTVTGHDLYFKIRENMYTADSMVLSAAFATSSTTLQTIDTDLDTYADTIYWQGDLTANTPVYITFPGTTQANINYDRNNQFLEINEQDSLKAEYNPSSTFTGITVTSRFSRGPIRQGVRMLFKDSVWLHGTITNKAQGLTYTLTDWALYNVTNLTQDIASGTVPAPQQLTPDQTYETPWHITNSSEHYYVSEFNWHVKWEPSEYLSTATTILDLPTLYQADGIAQKSISIVSTEPTRILDIEDFARHLGHPSIYFNATTITSTVPAGYTIQNITVWYSNITLGGSEYNITSNVTINLTSNIHPGPLSGIRPFNIQRIHIHIHKHIHPQNHVRHTLNPLRILLCGLPWLRRTRTPARYRRICSWRRWIQHAICIHRKKQCQNHRTKADRHSRNNSRIQNHRHKRPGHRKHTRRNNTPLWLIP